MYANFLKEILLNKRKIDEHKTRTLGKESNVVVLNKTPAKLKHSSSFSIPFLIGNINIDKDLCDLGLSMNLMPYSIVNRLEFGELRPNTISLQSADLCVKYPLCIGGCF